MTEEIIIAGFGGQGVLSMGQVLSYGALIENKEISWMPSYGPEMRGGTANCITIISDTQVSSPIISTFDTAIVLNQPSMDKFESKVKKGGLLLYDSTNILKPPTRKDIDILAVAAADEANKLNNTKVTNMIMLGAFLAKKSIISTDSALEGLKKVLPERYHHLLPLNKQALMAGMKLAKKVPVEA